MNNSKLITEMKKTFRFFGVIMCIMLMAVGLSACSGDDDDDKNSSIVGTWETSLDGYTTQMTFNSNGSCLWKEWNNSNPSDTDTDKGTYKVEGNKLSIWWDSEADENLEEGPLTVTFSISGNKMTTSENGGTVWTRK